MKAWSKFEQIIEQTNDYYRRKGLGVVIKIPNATKTIREYGKEKIIRTDKTGCDFIGHLNSVPVAFDCKSTNNKTSFPLEVHGKKMVKDHQQAYLTDFKKTGGRSFVLIQFNPLKRAFLVDIDAYIRMEAFAMAAGKKSIPIAMLEKYEVYYYLYYLDYIKIINQEEA